MNAVHQSEEPKFGDEIWRVKETLHGLHMRASGDTKNYLVAAMDAVSLAGASEYRKIFAERRARLTVRADTPVPRDGPEHDLEQAAKEAAQMAYCPYSKFPVGAAVLTSDGSIYRGFNIENASYGLTVCAERVAIFNAISAGKRPISLYVTCPKAGSRESERMPCGACRQVISEFFREDATILIGGDECVWQFSLKELLPSPFTLA